jgi:hypothetical protein
LGFVEIFPSLSTTAPTATLAEWFVEMNDNHDDDDDDDKVTN